MNEIAQNLTDLDRVEALSYTDMIALMEETNRCPGGLDTIRWIARETFLSPRSRILEIGSNTGYTSLELSRLTGCRAVGIDVNAKEVNVARSLAAGDIARVARRVDFQCASAHALPFADDSFDLVVAGGAFSFMEDLDVALSEAARVLKPWAFLSITNLCSLETPDQDLLDDLSRILGVPMAPSGPGDWVALFDEHSGLQRIEMKLERLSARSVRDVEDYVAYFGRKPHISQLPEHIRRRVLERWREILLTFNRNHRNLGFIRLLYRKPNLPQEPELFSIVSPSLRRFRQG